jgi:UrcA family protein
LNDYKWRKKWRGISMKKSVLARIGITAAAVLAVSIPAVSSASLESASSEEVRLSVNYADINLDSAAGVDRLYRRLKSAASSACGPTSRREAGSLEQISNNRICAVQLLDRAIQKVDNAELSKRQGG